jgi:hypothetical protein
MAFDNDALINQETGELDWTYIKRQALIRAQREYGDCAPPVRWVRNEITTLKDRAMGVRKYWRYAHGLPDDTAYSGVTITPYGRQHEGVRRSQF